MNSSVRQHEPDEQRRERHRNQRSEGERNHARVLGTALQHPIERGDRKAHGIGIAIADVDASVTRSRLRSAGQEEYLY